VHDGTTDYPLVMADDATVFVDANPFLDTDDIASESDDATERSKPFLLMGSSLPAIFAAGMAALAIAMAISIQPTADETPDAMPVPPGTAAAPPGPLSPAPQQVPDPAAVPPRLAAANATAH